MRRMLPIGLACALGAAVACGCSTTPSFVYVAEPDAASADGGAAGDATGGADGATGADGGASSDGAPGVDGSGGADAESDALSPDAAAFACGTTTVADCASCASAPFACASKGRCVASCLADCGGPGGAPIECIGCDPANQPVSYACEPPSDPTGCFVGSATRCQAPSDLSQCPGGLQVRINDACYACGESGTSGQDCKGGHACVTTGGGAYQCK